MKWVRKEPFRKREWRWPPFTMFLTGITRRNWFFGLAVMRDEPESTDFQRKPYYDFRFEYGPGYDDEKV